MRHRCEGACSCNTWRVSISLEVSFSTLDQRVCDCEYCQDNPSKLVSHSTLRAAFSGGQYEIRQNGDKLAGFYYCQRCGDFLCVARLFGKFSHGMHASEQRGAVSAELFPGDIVLGRVVPISPHQLSAEDKLRRWKSLWGLISGLPTIHS